MWQIESASTRLLKPIMLIDSTGELRDAVLGDVAGLPCVVRTLPSAERARIHLSSDEPLHALIIPPVLDGLSPVAFAGWVRRVRPGLLLLLLAGHGSAVAELEKQLEHEGLQDPLIRVAALDGSDGIAEAMQDLLARPGVGDAPEEGRAGEPDAAPRPPISSLGSDAALVRAQQEADATV